MLAYPSWSMQLARVRSENALQLRLQYMTAARPKMTRRLWVPMALWKPHCSVFTATALLAHTTYWWGAEKHIQNHQQKQVLHKQCNRTANKGSQGCQGTAGRRGIEVKAEKHFPFIWFLRFQQSRITYLEEHKCWSKLFDWVPGYPLYIMSKALHFGFLLSSKTDNKN